MVHSKVPVSDLIPVYKAKLPTFLEIEPYIKKIDQNEWYSNYGPLSTILEHRIAKYCGIDPSHVVTVTNATLALEGALATHVGVGTWDCPAWTFAATPSALIRSTKEFRFVDIDYEWRIAATAIDAPNKFIVDVLPFGASLNLGRIANNVETVLIDAAASFDSLRDIDIGSDKQIGVVLSFHATKSLPGGEGAVFLSNDLAWVNKVRQWGNFGFSKDRSAQFAGTNSKMSEYSAAVVLASLDRWDNDRLIWEELGAWAKELTFSLGIDVQPSLVDGYVSPYWIVQATPNVIEEIEISFRKAQIETRRWWGYGCHKMNAFSNVPRSNLEITDTLAISTLGLPFFKSLSQEARARIENTLRQKL
jgi:dTDP-4-amino-4,6-dideoxygalactose transaminase